MNPSDDTDSARSADDHLGDLVSAHLDGELDADTEARVAEHLASCERCRDAVQETRAARTMVRSLPVVHAGSVVDDVLARRRAAVRAGAMFVGLAGLVIGSLALTAAVIEPAVTPDVDAMVAAHRTMARTTADHATEPTAATGMGDVRRVREVSSPYSAPVSMEGADVSLDRRSVYDGDDLTVVVYRAGPSTVSVFQQPGRLDRDGLPPGLTVSSGDREAWVPMSSIPGAASPTVMVTQLGHVVVTAISEDPGAVVAVVESLPDRRRDGAWERVHDACSRITEVFALGG